MKKRGRQKMELKTNNSKAINRNRKVDGTKGNGGKIQFKLKMSISGNDPNEMSKRDVKIVSMFKKAIKG